MCEDGAHACRVWLVLPVALRHTRRPPGFARPASIQTPVTTGVISSPPRGSDTGSWANSPSRCVCPACGPCHPEGQNAASRGGLSSRILPGKAASEQTVRALGSALRQITGSPPSTSSSRGMRLAYRRSRAERVGHTVVLGRWGCPSRGICVVSSPQQCAADPVRRGLSPRRAPRT